MPTKPISEIEELIGRRFAARGLQFAHIIAVKLYEDPALAWLRPLNPTRPHVTTLGLGSKVARITPLCAPADRRRRRNAKTSRRRTAAHSAIHRCQKGASAPSSSLDVLRFATHPLRARLWRCAPLLFSPPSPRI